MKIENPLTMKLKNTLFMKIEKNLTMKIENTLSMKIEKILTMKIENTLSMRGVAAVVCVSWNVRAQSMPKEGILSLVMIPT